MPKLEQRPLAQRIARLAEFLASTDAIRVRIERPGEEIELSRAPRSVPAAARPAGGDGVAPAAAPVKLDMIKADLVGILRFSRPAPVEGEQLDEDRELGYIEALGIRTPVHSLGGGRIASIPVADGAPVEYGQTLFFLDRG